MGNDSNEGTVSLNWMRFEWDEMCKVREMEEFGGRAQRLSMYFNHKHRHKTA